jgi:MFS family permease
MGGICQITIPEIMAGLNSDTFSFKQKKQLSEKAASLGTLGMGLSYIFAPIVAGALNDSGGWIFTTDTSAWIALSLATSYGIIVLLGYTYVPDYKR